MSITLPEGWANDADFTVQPLTVKTVTVSLKSGSTTLSGTFKFNVSQQPLSAGSLLTVRVLDDIIGLRFLVEDVSDYVSKTNTNPRYVFGDNYTKALIMALRQLPDGNPIPRPDSMYSVGADRESYVESVEFSQIKEDVHNAFIATCSIREYPTIPGAVDKFETNPKSARIEDVPPWMMDADITFSVTEGEGFTYGFAYHTTSLDTSYRGSLRNLLQKSKPIRAYVEPIINTAGEPFASPPAMPTIISTLSVKRSFLRAGINAGSVQDAVGKLNSSDISINVSGAKITFPERSLLLSGFSMVPKVYALQIDWLPGTKHPLNKTYGELFYGYAGVTGSTIAVNRTGSKITVSKPYRYLEVSATFTYKPNGWGVWIANRGYYEKKDDGKLGGSADDNDRMKERWLDKNGKFIKDKDEQKRIWIGYTAYEDTSIISTVLSELMKEGTTDIKWAGKDDIWGGRLA